jgi:hypothetical protein
MPTSDTCAAKVIVTALAAALAAGGAAAQESQLDTILARVGARIEDFYKRAQSLMCLEKVTAQAITNDLSAAGFARVLEYDLRVELASIDDPDGSDANFVRELRKVNGRVPRARDLNDRNSCLDPNPLTPEPLSFLLRKNRAEYMFTWAGFGKGRDQNTIMIDYRPRQVDKPAFIEDERGRDDCFQLSLPVERQGRVYVDAQSFDVVKIEQHLKSRVEVRVPLKQQRVKNLPDWIVVDRFDWVIRYKPVSFQNPDETLLLPASIEQVALLRGAQSNRKTQVFSDYRRFLTAGRVVK